MSERRLTRRSLLQGAAVLTVGSVVAACAPKVQETVVEPQKEAEKVIEEQVPAPQEKALVRLGKSAGASRQYAHKFSEEFGEMNPHITVVVEDVPYADLFTKGLAMGATGQMWDVFEGHTRWMPYFAHKDITLQLDEFIEKHDVDFEDIFPSVIACSRNLAEGKLMWFPTGVHPGASALIALNMDLLGEAGIDDVPCDPIEGDWTLDDYEELIRKVARPPEIFGTQLSINGGPLSMQQYGRSWGSDPVKGSEDAWLLSPDGRQQQLGDEWPRVKASLEWYYNLTRDGYVPKDAQREMFPGVNLFTAGMMATRACMVSEPENWREAIGDSFEARYVPWPKGPDGHRGSCLSYNTMAVSSSSSYPEEAFLLMAHVTGPEAALWTGTEGEGMCHARRSAWFSPKLWERPSSGPGMQFTAHWLDAGVDPFPQPWNHRFVEWQEAWFQHMQPYFNVEETWAEMLSHAQTACQRILDLPLP